MPAGLYCLLGLLIFAGLCQLTLSRDRASLLCRGILQACFVTGSCQRLALLRECPPACGLPLDFASQSKSLAGSCWLGLGESPLIVLLCCFVLFLAAKSAASQHGMCASSYYFHSDYLTTLLPLPSLDCARRAPPSNQRGWMHAEWAISVYPLLRAHSACTHQQPVTNYEWRSRPTQPLLPSAANDQPRVAKQTNPATAPISNQ